MESLSIEGNCWLLCGASKPSEDIAVVCEDIQLLLRMHPHYKSCWGRTEGNTVAHMLAQFAMQNKFSSSDKYIGKRCAYLMEQTNQLPPGLRHLNLKKSFKLGIHSLLTTCSKEEFSKAFPRFTNAEQEGLHRLFIQVITSLHENIEVEFESLCPETQVETVLDTVEELVEEHNLDPLFSDKSFKVGDLEHDLSVAKKNEIQYLMGMLEMAEEQKSVIRARIEQMKKERQDFSGAAGAVEKLKTRMLNYSTCNSTVAP